MQGARGTRRWIARTVLAAALAGMLAACSSGATRSPSGSSPTAEATSTAASPSLPEGVVAVSLSEMDLLVSTAVAPAGEVTFEIRNAGELPHELVVIRTDEDADELPVEDVRVVERRLDIVARSEHIPAGQHVTLRAELEPGHYVLICNLSGHYEESQFGPGMRADFDVDGR